MIPFKQGYAGLFPNCHGIHDPKLEPQPHLFLKNPKH